MESRVTKDNTPSALFNSTITDKKQAGAGERLPLKDMGKEKQQAPTFDFSKMNPTIKAVKEKDLNSQPLANLHPEANLMQRLKISLPSASFSPNLTKQILGFAQKQTLQVIRSLEETDRAIDVESKQLRHSIDMINRIFSDPDVEIKRVFGRMEVLFGKIERRQEKLQRSLKEIPNGYNYSDALKLMLEIEEQISQLTEGVEGERCGKLISIEESIEKMEKELLRYDSLNV